MRFAETTTSLGLVWNLGTPKNLTISRFIQNQLGGTPLWCLTSNSAHWISSSRKSTLSTPSFCRESSLTKAERSPAQWNSAFDWKDNVCVFSHVIPIENAWNRSVFANPFQSWSWTHHCQLYTVSLYIHMFFKDYIYIYITYLHCIILLHPVPLARLLSGQEKVKRSQRPANTPATSPASWEAPRHRNNKLGLLPPFHMRIVLPIPGHQSESPIAKSQAE